ncbi:hypothetical protein FNV43_RR15992 [Rhamnella rubrinervis]|uniref:Thioredoxin-like protein AAED1, chloroplastic n=1 Tax=Rhamnella rubrinervis TaxID=2594499 RepID=A0A8K0GXI7_9ROSA|nr:hypothetical protein FNV43_RR15992 [Rhamnella rubrinervis]
MAAALCSTVFSTTLQPNRFTNHTSTRVLPSTTTPNNPPSPNRNLSFSQLLGFSPRQRSHIVASALSGIESSVAGEDETNLLDTAKVFDLNGVGIPISDLWKDRRAVVAFARHFGCVLCRKRADYLASKKDIMDASGVALVLIGPGSIDQAKTFSEQTKFKGEVYADPTHSSYEALRFVSGVSTTFTPKAGLKIIQLYMEGYRQDWKLSFEKDTVSRGGWQQGGIIVAGPGKSNISYIHKDKEAGDDPDIEEILEACCS